MVYWGHKKVLLADDRALHRELVRDILSQMGIKFIDDAEDGAQALALLDKRSYDLAIMDLKMPQINGYEAIQKIRSFASYKDLPIIAITGAQDDEAVEKAFAAGANDYLEKPFHIADIRNRVSFHLSYAERMREMAACEAVMKEDLERARYCQTQSMPALKDWTDIWQRHHLDVAAHYIPSRYLSGDSWNVVAIDDKRLLFYMLDVTGHGLNAAISNAFIQTALRQCLQRLDISTTPQCLCPYIMSRLNDTLCEQLPSSVFAAGFFLLHEKGAETMEYAAAAFPPAMLLRQDSTDSTFIGGKALPLGVSKPHFQPTSGQVAWQQGDALICMTDGLPESLPEAEDGQEEANLHKYGSFLPGERLLDTCYKDLMHDLSVCTAEDMMAVLLTAFDKHDYDTARDDITVLVLRHI